MLSTKLGFYVVDNFLFYLDLNGVMLFDVRRVKVLHEIKRLKEYLKQSEDHLGYRLDSHYARLCV